MNRRGFFGQFSKGAAATVLAPMVAFAPMAADDPDDFTVNGYRVKWSGWNQRPDQNVTCGMWLAKHGTQDLQWVSTTLGQCYPNRDWEVVDMTLAHDWPLITTFSSDADRTAVKARALIALREKLA